MGKVILRQLVKEYHDAKKAAVQAVKGIDLEIRDGEFMVLVGPSGCGKSTTLRMIAGLESVTAGSIEIDGRAINRVAPKDRGIAMVFQNYALYPHMTVFENMAFALRMMKLPKADVRARVDEAAAILGLGDLLDRKPRALSGGQRQRVAVGRAIVRKPTVFLFDEPLSNLDAKMRVSMRSEISKLHGRLGATMIYVTHDQVEAMTMGDRITVMNDGAIMQVADPLTLYRSPANTFVAGFIGNPPMNLLPGHVNRTGGALAFATGSGTGSLKIPLDERLTGPVGERASIVLGLRPEAIHDEVPTESRDRISCMDTTVELAEPMGGETVLHVNVAGQPLIARLHHDRTYSVGESVRLFFDARDVHLFDAASGRVLCGES